MNRRKFLSLLGGGGVIVAAGAGFGARVSRTPDAALAPWADAGALYTEPRKKALSYAILAPNPHNRQPWLVDLSVPDQVTLFVDTERLLPHTDPLNRQITVGLGCFLELMTLAAANEGYRVELALFPEGDSVEGLDKRPIATAQFIKDSNIKADPLFAHVLNRRSVKEPYDLGRSVSSDALNRIAQSTMHGTTIGFSNETDQVQKLRDLTREAMMIEFHTPRTFKESVDLFRIGADEINANPDGIDFSGTFFEAMHVTGMMTREGTLVVDSMQFNEGVKAVNANTDTAMAHLWQITNDNTRMDQINAGRDWMRLHLAITAEGISMQPMSQALQEFEEMASLYKQVHQELAPDGGTVQMLGRLGYAAPVAVSPRWGLEHKIL